MEDLKLKPCPFCGSEDIQHINEDDAVECLQCRANIPLAWADSKADPAADAWNRRVSGWISVKKRLPKAPDSVLCFSPKSRYFIAFYDDGKWITHKAFGDPTHWTFLPEPPEVSER